MDTIHKNDSSDEVLVGVISTQDFDKAEDRLLRLT